MTVRNYGGVEYDLSYDAENRLTAVSGPDLNVSFVYDGDGLSAERQAGNRVKGSVGPVTTAYGGNIYAWNGIMVKYYYAGSTRAAMRTGSTLYWLLDDHITVEG